jgi:uncharacterized protein YndB with AHSA1/START domain
MPITLDSSADTPVRKRIVVKTSVTRAFKVFTEGFDTWWPRSHHIGNAPMKKGIIENRKGGRCYSEQIDGTECDWGRVLAWEPPYRLVFAWQITPRWQYEPDLSRASEVEITFTPQDDGSTLVELEHRHFERHGGGWEKMREGVGAPGGWGSMLELYSVAVQNDENAPELR